MNSTKRHVDVQHIFKYKFEYLYKYSIFKYIFKHIYVYIISIHSKSQTYFATNSEEMPMKEVTGNYRKEDSPYSSQIN